MSRSTLCSQVGNCYDVYGSFYNDTEQYEDSRHDVTTTQLYIVITYLCVLALAGTTGNVLVLYVFMRKRSRTVSNFFISTLASIDLAVCALLMPFTVYMESVQHVVYSGAVCRLYHFLITSNIPFSALVIVAIATDRYLCICHPFRQLLTLRVARNTVVVMALLAVVMGCCVAINYDVEESLDIPHTHEIYEHMVNYVQRDRPEVDYEHQTTDAGRTSTVALTIASRDRNSTPHDDVIHYSDNRHRAEASSSSSEDAHISVNLSSGQCVPNDSFWSASMLEYYQKVHISMYIACLLIVLALYALICRKVVLHRRRRRAIYRGATHATVFAMRATNRGNELLELVNVDTRNSHETTTAADNNQSSICHHHRDSQRRSRQQRQCQSVHEAAAAASRIFSFTTIDKLTAANIKTAGMLFAVTVIFFITFLPAVLIALHIIDYSPALFYAYFVNNVANPIIYSFMNKNFRDDVRVLVTRSHVIITL